VNFIFADRELAHNQTCGTLPKNLDTRLIKHKEIRSRLNLSNYNFREVRNVGNICKCCSTRYEVLTAVNVKSTVSLDGTRNYLVDRTHVS
jgi:hypothetical protein